MSRLVGFIRSLVGDSAAQRYRKVYDFEGANFVCTQEQLSATNPSQTLEPLGPGVKQRAAGGKKCWVEQAADLKCIHAVWHSLLSSQASPDPCPLSSQASPDHLHASIESGIARPFPFKNRVRQCPTRCTICNNSRHTVKHRPTFDK